MTNYTYANIWSNTMKSETVEVSKSYRSDGAIKITKRNGALIVVTPFEVNEYDEGDGITTWLEAKRYITIHLCGVVAFEYEEKVTIDYEHNEMYSEVEGYEVDTCGVYIY